MPPGMSGAEAFAGRPLVQWTIESAQRSGLFDRVWICGADENVARLAEALGAGVLNDPSSRGGNDAHFDRVIRSMAANVPRGGYTDLYLLRPTTPLRRHETIRRAWDTYLEHDAEALLSVVAHEHPPQWMLVEEDGWLKPLDAEHFEVPRQRLVPSYRHDGSHWIARLPLAASPLTGRTMPFEVDPPEALAVTHVTDLPFAESLVRARWQGC